MAEYRLTKTHAAARAGRAQRPKMNGGSFITPHITSPATCNCCRALSRSAAAAGVSHISEIESVVIKYIGHLSVSFTKL